MKTRTLNAYIEASKQARRLIWDTQEELGTLHQKAAVLIATATHHADVHRKVVKQKATHLLKELKGVHSKLEASIAKAPTQATRAKLRVDSVDRRSIYGSGCGDGWPLTLPSSMTQPF